ncbi:hypothetical protein B0J17DRAFT_754631 [Rhizoctonia solani]|nr:hypothetical protein B0J17DRAFT_754631 [Rhizoctonia solani]
MVSGGDSMSETWIGNYLETNVTSSCQYGGGSGNQGINAPKGTYAQYLNTCGQITNETLPVTIQKAVCSSKVKLPSYVYRPSWQTSGEWYYDYTKSKAELRIQSGENETNYMCNGLIIDENTNPVSTSGTSLNKTYIPTRGIIGFTLGGIALLCLGAIGGYLFGNWRTRRGSRRTVIDLMGPHNESLLQPIYEPYRSRPSSDPPIQSATLYPMGYNMQGKSELAYTSSSGLIHPTNSAQYTMVDATAPAPRRQKERFVQNNPVDRPLDESSHPFLACEGAGDRVQRVNFATPRPELPPSYAPRGKR